MGSKKVLFIMCCSFLLASKRLYGQQEDNKIDSFWIHGDIKITIDKPASFGKNKKTIIIFYALPNGNTTEQTMGKLMQPGTDWHFDIQHIRAQTSFIRSHARENNFVVIYLENSYKSWPLWKQKHHDFKLVIPHLIDSLTSMTEGRKKNIYLNGHSGGGSFIFGYLAGVEVIPAKVKRISFIDSNYGYDSTYYSKFRDWLSVNRESSLNVFAYNDSVALYNGKPVVSATGGTWYKSHLFLKHLRRDFNFEKESTDSLVIYRSPDQRIQFYFKFNTDRGIYHTQQVELNGFIHSVLCGTKKDSRHYFYYGKRAYNHFIAE